MADTEDIEDVGGTAAATGGDFPEPLPVGREHISHHLQELRSIAERSNAFRSMSEEDAGRYRQLQEAIVHSDPGTIPLMRSLAYVQQPDYNPQVLNQERALAHARNRWMGQESLRHNLLSVLPGARQGQQIAESMALRESQERYQRGEATMQDVENIARMERQGEIEQQRSPLEQVGQTILQTPAMAAEMMGAAGVASAVAPSAGLVGGAARLGAFTAANPPTLAGGIQSNVEAGRGALNVTGLSQQFTLDAVTNGIFMAASNPAGGGIRGYLRNLGAAMGASEFTKEAEGLLGITTGHGAIGALLEGRHGEAFRELATDALSIGTLQLMHGASPEEARRAVEHRLSAADTAAGSVEGSPGETTYTPPGPRPITPAEERPTGLPPNLRPPEAAPGRPGAEGGQGPSESAPERTWQHTGTVWGEGNVQGTYETTVSGRRVAIEARPAAEGTLDAAQRRPPGSERLAIVDARTGQELFAGTVIPGENGTHHIEQDVGLAARRLDKGEMTRGLANALYDFVSEDVRLVPSKTQTEAGKTFWRKNAEHARPRTQPLQTPAQRPVDTGLDVATERAASRFEPRTEGKSAEAYARQMHEAIVSSLEEPAHVTQAKRDQASAHMEQASEAMRRAGFHPPGSTDASNRPLDSRVQAGLNAHFNQLLSNHPEAAHALARLLLEHPNRAADILAALPQALREGVDHALEAVSGGQGDQASLRRGLESRLRESLGLTGAQPAGPGSEGSNGAQAPEGPAQAAGAAQVSGEPGPSAPAPSGAAGNVVSRAQEQIAEHVPESVQELARQTHASGDRAHWRDMEHVLRTVFGDEVADAMLDRLGPQTVTSDAAKGLQGVNRTARTDMQREALLDHVLTEARNHAALKATQAGHSPAEIAEAVRAGQADGEAEAGDAFEGSSEGQAFTQAQLDDFERELTGFTPRQPGSEHTSNLPTVQRSGPERPGGVDSKVWDITSSFLKEEGGFLDLQKIKDFALNQYDVMRERLRRVSDGFRKFAGEKLPAMSRLHEASADAGARFDTAPERARMAAPFFTDQMMGSQEHTEAQRKFIGATFTEWRLQHMQGAFHQEATRLFLASQQAPNQATRLRLAKEAQEYLKRAQAVQSFIGTPGYAADQAAFQRDLNSPPFREFLARWAGAGGFAEVMEKNYRDAKGLQPTDPIDTLSQIPHFPINLLGIDRAPGGPGVGRGNLANTRARKLAFSNEATGTAPAYETDIGKIIENSLIRGETLAAKARWLRTMVEGGVAEWGRHDQRPEGAFEIPNVRPPKGTQANAPLETSLYVKGADVMKEARQLLQVDKPWSRIPGTQLLTGINLAGLTEAGYHTLNNMTMMFKPGMSPVRLASNAWKVMRGDPQVMRTVLELSQQGVGFRESHGGLFGGGKYDPTGYVSKFLDGLHRTMTLTMNDAFDSMAARGDVPDTATNRRNFLSQLGNYSKRSQNSVVAFLRDTGIGPTSTAGTNFTAQALRAMALQPGVEATSPQAALRLRASMLARGMGILASVAAANFLRWGRLDGDDNTPLGALKIGESNGRTQYLDIFGYTPWGRGMKATGAASLLEGQRAGARFGPSVDQAAHHVFGTLLHPFFGAPVQTGYMAATGQNIATGRQVAPLARSGESQRWEDLKAALWNVNPAVATLTGHNVAPGRGGQAPEMDWQQLLGPLGPRTSRQPPGRERPPTITVPLRR